MTKKLPNSEYSDCLAAAVVAAAVVGAAISAAVGASAAAAVAVEAEEDDKKDDYPPVASAKAVIHIKSLLLNVDFKAPWISPRGFIVQFMRAAKKCY